MTVVSPSVLVTDRFAEVTTEVVSLPVLLVPSGSVVDEVAVAELIRSPPATFAGTV
jgi:hypothetical protein